MRHSILASAMQITCVMLLSAFARVSLADDEAPASEESTSTAVSFSNDIAPILAKNCLACHGTDEPKAGYQLHTYEHLLQAGESELESVTPGDLDDSYLYYLLTEEDPDVRMPKDGEPLPREQVALVRRWIRQGAKFDGPDAAAPLASLLPRESQPAAPEAYRVPVPVAALDFSPDGSELAVGGYHEVTIWSAADGSLQRRINDVGQRTYAVAYSPDGAVLAVASGTPGQSGEVALYDPAAGTLLRSLCTMIDVACDVAFRPDGQKLAACGADRSIRIFDATTGNEDVLIEDHADWVMGIAWNAEGTQLVSASRDKTSKLFDAATGDSLITYPGHGDTVYAGAFSADGKLVYTAGADKLIHAWNPEDGKQAGTFKGYAGEIFRLRLVDGKLFGCASDKTVRQHAAEDRKEVRAYEGHDDYVYSLSLDVPHGRVAAGSYDGTVRVWNLEDGAQQLEFLAAPGYTPDAANQQASAK